MHVDLLAGYPPREGEEDVRVFENFPAFRPKRPVFRLGFEVYEFFNKTVESSEYVIGRPMGGR